MNNIYFRSMKKLTLLAFLQLACFFSFGQWQVRDSSLFNPHITIGYGYSTPGGDLANRFGNNGSIEVGFHVKDKKNWYYGVQFNYLFGNKVHEPNLLSNLLTSRGEILDEQGQIATMFIQERGFNVFVHGGKLFPVIGPNKNSGLLITAGVGLLQHKIRIEHQEAKITQLEGEYLKGYDRLTNGLSVNQFIAAAVSEKMASVMTLDYLKLEAAKGDRSDFDRFMNLVPSVPPLAGDALPK